MNNLNITCESLEQRQDVFDVLDVMGLKHSGVDACFLSINADLIRNKYMTVVDGDVRFDSKILTYQEFMDKYSMNQLKTKIEEVKVKLGLTQMQLSERIGKNPYYLDTVKHRGVTTERQLELIRELDLVANGGTVMTERELIASLSEQLVEAQDKAQKAQAANKELYIKLKVAEHEHRQLESIHDSNWDNLQEYKRQYRDLVATVIVIGIIAVLGFAI